MNSKKKSRETQAEQGEALDGGGVSYVQFHIRIGWWSLLVFLSLGIVLESMHAFRVQWYLAADQAEWRRLMWTLAHAHGVLISLVHVAFAVSVYLFPCWSGNSRALASCCLLSSGILMPVGFFLGGLFVYDSDPGLGVMLVPIGSASLFIAVLVTGLAVTRHRVDSQKNAESSS